MSKVLKDSWFDSNLSYVVFALFHLFFWVMFTFNLFDYGHAARAAGLGWHIAASIVELLTVWLAVEIAIDNSRRPNGVVDSSRAIVQALLYTLYLLVPFLLTGFNFNYI